MAATPEKMPVYVKPDPPAPDTVPKLPQTIFNFETKGSRATPTTTGAVRENS